MFAVKFIRRIVPWRFVEVLQVSAKVLLHVTLLGPLQILRVAQFVQHASTMVVHLRRCLLYRFYSHYAKLCYRCLFKKDVPSFLQLFFSTQLNFISLFRIFHQFGLLLISHHFSLFLKHPSPRQLQLIPLFHHPMSIPLQPQSLFPLP